jgi:hypothetical protein
MGGDYGSTDDAAAVVWCFGHAVRGHRPGSAETVDRRTIKKRVDMYPGDRSDRPQGYAPQFLPLPYDFRIRLNSLLRT